MWINVGVSPQGVGMAGIRGDVDGVGTLWNTSDGMNTFLTLNILRVCLDLNFKDCSFLHAGAGVTSGTPFQRTNTLRIVEGGPCRAPSHFCLDRILRPVGLTPRTLFNSPSKANRRFAEQEELSKWRIRFAIRAKPRRRLAARKPRALLAARPNR